MGLDVSVLSVQKLGDSHLSVHHHLLLIVSRWQCNCKGNPIKSLFEDFLQPSSGPSYGGGEVYDHDLGQSDYQNQSEVSISYGTNNSNVSYGHQVNNQQPNYNQNFNQQGQYGDQYKEEFKGTLPSYFHAFVAISYQNLTNF